MKRQIAPLKQWPRPAWSFTGLNDCSRTHRGEGSDLTQEALEVLVRNVTGDAFIPENLFLPQCIVPLCEDPARVAVLATLREWSRWGVGLCGRGGEGERRVFSDSTHQTDLSFAFDDRRGRHRSIEHKIIYSKCQTKGLEVKALKIWLHDRR